MPAYWVSTNRMTLLVETDARDVVIQAAPIARKFIGQPAANLRKWLERQGGYVGVEMPPAGSVKCPCGCEGA